jgi:hypothetical protein
MCVVEELRAVDVRSSHQFEEDIGAASSENWLFIAKMGFSVWTGRLKGLSVLRGNLHGAFLGGGAAAMSPCYPTRPDEIFGTDKSQVSALLFSSHLESPHVESDSLCEKRTGRANGQARVALPRYLRPVSNYEILFRFLH